MTKGTYQLIANLKSGFLSITAHGHKLGSKKDVTDVVSCFQYIMNAKGLIGVGGKNDGFSKESGEPLEIVPLKDPTSVKAGDTLPVKVMFQGKPLAKAKVQGTHTGYTGDEKKQWAVEGDTDSKGIFGVKLTSKGQWMFRTGSFRSCIRWALTRL